MPQAQLTAGPVRQLAAIRLYVRSPFIVNVTDTRDGFWWNGKPREQDPHKSLIDKMICFGEVNESHVKRGDLVLRQLTKWSGHEDPIDLRTLPSKAAVLLLWDIFLFVVVFKRLAITLWEPFPLCTRVLYCSLLMSQPHHCQAIQTRLSHLMPCIVNELTFFFGCIFC